ncbi:MAG: hypothetical protein ACREIM_04220 [Nitrospiraceae bacterium]
MPSGADISDFINSSWGLTWLMLFIALGYGWYRMKTFFPIPASSSRSFSQGDSFTSSASHRTIALVLYASGSLMVLFALPFLVTPMGPERSEFTGGIILSIVGVADLTAGVILLRAAKNRRDMASPTA